jgi:multisubunit Na+/H+ antiporter MnhG subunit
VATHMLARAATRCGVVLWQGTVNELPTVDKPTLKVSS